MLPTNCPRIVSLDVRSATRAKDQKEEPPQKTYPVQKNGDIAISVNGGLVAAQLGDLADDADVLVDKGVEAGRGDARCGNVFRHGC